MFTVMLQMNVTRSYRFAEHIKFRGDKCRGPRDGNV